MLAPPSTPIPQPSPPTEILPAWTSSDPAPTKFHSAGALGYSGWMSGYPGGDIRYSMPTEMPSTGMSRYPASTEIQSALAFGHAARICGYSTPTGIQSAPIRRPVKPDSHRPSREARNRAPNAPQCALHLAAAGTVAGIRPHPAARKASSGRVGACVMPKQAAGRASSGAEKHAIIRAWQSCPGS
jgi:hypothetical protein